VIKNQSLIEKVEDIETKYQTEKKEKENLKLKAKNIEAEAEQQKSKIFLMVSLLFILLGGTIGLLSLKNSKRKRKLAEQDKELETQKNLTLLKEQELTTINAMVDGQEKERKRIAEDLHDNLGSVLATLKLHFENLKMNREKKKINQETLFDKTENLIDEAYLKVRRIAHAKNAGVIANQGLLVAVQMMAEKISSADKIKIEVIDFGLDKRLENSLEITIFRIIQELLTNVMKHAAAKNATINISLYDKNLNIIIEDNGKGFDFKKVNLKDGMGISSIKTRIEHLDGTFNVDSTIGKGSSIIIDIPVD
jgi:signal transduction histidine kinase